MTPFSTLHHVCVVVADIDAATAAYEAVGIGPWRDYPPLTDYTDLDVPDREAFLDLRYKVTDTANVQLQLCQPGPGLSPQRRFLDAHGEGVFHLGFVVDDAGAAEADVRARGLDVLMRGRRPDGTGFTYYDSAATAGVVLLTRQSPPGAA